MQTLNRESFCSFQCRSCVRCHVDSVHSVIPCLMSSGSQSWSSQATVWSTVVCSSSGICRRCLFRPRYRTLQDGSSRCAPGIFVCLSLPPPAGACLQKSSGESVEHCLQQNSWPWQLMLCAKVGQCLPKAQWNGLVKQGHRFKFQDPMRGKSKASQSLLLSKIDLRCPWGSSRDAAVCCLTPTLIQWAVIELYELWASQGYVHKR